jgi:hypothetical protein
MQVQGAFNLLFRPGLRKDFLDEWQRYEPEYTEFLKTSSTDMPEQSATIITGFSRFVERFDGEPVTYDDPKIGPKVMGVDKEFALGYILSRKTVEDDLYGKANSASKWLADAAAMTQEYRSAALLDDAFTGATFKGIDQLSLCNTAHILLNSNLTVSNSLATPVSLSVTGITAMLDLVQQMRNENGDPIRMMPNKLVISNNAGDYHRAMQIFGTDKEPFTAENQDNAIKKRMPNMKIVTSHFKAAGKQYFMLDDKYNDAQFVTRRKLEFDDTFDFDTSAAKYMASMRFLIWFVGWRGWFGANPT